MNDNNALFKLIACTNGGGPPSIFYAISVSGDIYTNYVFHNVCIRKLNT
jgi:hypothetical protein